MNRASVVGIPYLHAVKHPITCLLLFLSSLGSAQVHCDGTRYIQSVFTQVDSVIGVQYGANTTIGGAQRNLLADVYFPESEFFFARPLVILAHGGSFIVGSRKEMRPLCIALAEKGFVIATIDYRLYDAFATPLDSLVVFDVALKATMDMKAAIRWFREDAAGNNDFGIDTQLVFAGGISAGAITALHAGFLDMNDIQGHTAFDSILQANGGIHGNSSFNHQYGDDVVGILNYSGALKDARWIDSGEPVVFSVHDEFDGVVPYYRDHSDAMGTPVELWGSYEVNQKARAAGIRSQLITIDNSTQHVSYFLNGSNDPNYALAVDSAAIFMEYAICDRMAGTEKNPPLTPSPVVFPNPTYASLRINGMPKVDRIQLIDASGRKVLSAAVEPNAYIDVSSLGAGVYAMLLFHGDQPIHRERIVKQ